MKHAYTELVILASLLQSKVETSEHVCYLESCSNETGGIVPNTEVVSDVSTW